MTGVFVLEDVMAVEETLKNNPVKTALCVGMYSLFYDALYEQWVVQRGAGHNRVRKTDFMSLDFSEAFEHWKTKID